MYIEQVKHVPGPMLEWFLTYSVYKKWILEFESNGYNCTMIIMFISDLKTFFFNFDSHSKSLQYYINHFAFNMCNPVNHYR